MGFRPQGFAPHHSSANALGHVHGEVVDIARSRS
jgi:hypothetical protein